MSETTEDSKGNFDVIDKISKKYFLEVENSVPHMQQVLFDLQNEFYKAWKNSINSGISLQKEFLDKSEFDFTVPEVAKSFVENMNEEAVRYRAYWNKVMIENIGSAKKYAKTLNENEKLFLDFNRKTMNFWMSTFLQKRN